MLEDHVRRGLNSHHPTKLVLLMWQSNFHITCFGSALEFLDLAFTCTAVKTSSPLPHGHVHCIASRLFHFLRIHLWPSNALHYPGITIVLALPMRTFLVLWLSISIPY